MPILKPPTEEERLEAEETRKRLDKMILKYKKKGLNLGSIKPRPKKQ
ncbi:hypothetical protein OAB15_02450 [Porticoccaceae bacterium]|nr:hypothetical protein [Porticoccaceae bacterium]